MAGELQTHQRTVTNVDRPRTEHVWLGSRNHQLRRHLKKKIGLGARKSAKDFKQQVQGWICILQRSLSAM